MTLVYLAGAWLLGVVAGAVSGELWWPGVAAIGVAGLVAALLERRPQLAIVGLLAAGLFVAGDARFLDQRPPDEPADIALHNDASDTRFRALVSDEPDVRGRTQRVQLAVREVFEDGAWRETSGGVLLRAGLFPRYEYGDVLEIEGELETPPSFPDFDYRDYLARQGVVSIVQYPEARTIATGEGTAALAALHDVRGRLGDALTDALPEPQAALAQGIFLGQRSAIPQDLTDDLNATGTSHLIAISGHNVSLVAALIIAAFAWLIGRRQAALIALIAIAGYTALTGASPTVVRAAIMGGLFVIATLAGRPTSAATSIALAAAIMTGLNPLVIEDVSFQLSFAAIAGLVYIAPPLQARTVELLRRWGVEAEGGVAGFLIESSAVTAGAVAATLPLIALNFERVSLVAIVANLLLVPAFPLILFSSAVTAAAGAIWAPLGDVSAVVSWALLTYMIEVARFFAAIPLASVAISGFGPWHAAVAYLALTSGVWLLVRRRPTPDIEPERVAVRAMAVQPAWMLAGGLALVSAFAWFSILGGDDHGRLTVSVLDVGQGDAILIESPDGHHVLIDGGADGRRLLEQVGRELPFWNRTIDLVALTHPQEDHLVGLVDALERYNVGQVLASPRASESAAYEEWRSLIDRQDIPYREASVGDRIDLGDGIVIEVLGPDEALVDASDVNDASLVLRLRWRGVSFLLTGDIEARAEESLLASDASLTASVLKVAHHGANTSSSAAFLRAVDPAVALISVGADNTFGHPSRAVLERLGDTAVFRTDEHGTIRISTDGERIWVDAER